MIPTGLIFELPSGSEAQVRPRSDVVCRAVGPGDVCVWRPDAYQLPTLQSGLRLAQTAAGSLPGFPQHVAEPLISSTGRPVDEEIPGSYGEDYDWMLRAAAAGPIAVVPEPLVTVLWGRTSHFNRKWATIGDALEYLLRKHPAFADDPRGLARVQGQIAFAHAALGERPAARAWALRTLRSSWRERRAYLALLVSLRVLSADRVLRLAHSAGRGI